MTRAIAFTNTIANSKSLVNHWDGVIESAMERMPEDQRLQDFIIETEHSETEKAASVQLGRESIAAWFDIFVT